MQAITLRIQEAMQNGSKTYQGKPCKYGHSGLRYVSNKKCLDCDRARSKGRSAVYVHPVNKLFDLDPVEYLKGEPVAISRQVATSSGWKYYRGKPCCAGHVIRYTSSAVCFECRRVKNALNQKDPKYKAQIADWQFRNPDKVKEKHRRWYKANPEKITMLFRERVLRRRTLLYNAKGEYSPEQAKMLLVAQGNACAYCGKKSDFSLDHKVPLFRGGTNDISNLQWLCRSHNSRKNTRTDEEYRKIASIPSATMWDAPPYLRMIINNFNMLQEVECG